MYTPRREPTHRTAAAFLTVCDLLSTGLAERDLQDVLAGVECGLTIEYGYPDEVREPGFARFRIDIDDAREHRVLVLLRFVSEAMGATVDWDPRRRVIGVRCRP